MSQLAEFVEFADRCGLRVEPFQKRIVRAFLSDCEEEVVVLLPRGGGKTALVALYGLWHLLETEDARVDFTAATREQASIAYEHAVRFAVRLQDDRLHPTRRELHFLPDPGRRHFTRFMRVRPGDSAALQGLDSTLAVIDELHTAKDDSTYVAMQGALKAPGARLRIISTAAPSTDSPLGDVRGRALALPGASRKGAVVEAKGKDLHLLEWSCPDGTETTDMRAVMAANPASWRTREVLERKRAAVAEGSFRRYFMNMHATQAESSWLGAGVCDACRADYQIETCEKVWCGLDVGGSRSATALCWATEDLRLGVKVWHGAESVLWARAELERVAEQYSVVEVAFDPWHAAEIALDLAPRLRFVEFPQTVARLGPATQELTAAILERRLKHPGDPELDRHVANTVLRATPRGDVLSKAGGKHSPDQPIDAVMAACMAVSRALAPKPAAPQLLGWL